MTLHCESIGSGPDVVLIHGWGWHSGVWDAVASQLMHEFRVWLPDLPGHGRSRGPVADLSLAGLTQAIATAVPRSAIWIGWSLGGLVALTAAQQGIAQRLVLVATTPRFVQTQAWEYGQTTEWFRHFTDEFAQDAPRALERLASLHLTGNGNERPLLRQLRAALLRYPVDAAALQAGLRLLEATDLRALLPTIQVPALVVHGTCDHVATVQAGEYLARSLPDARFVPVADAGHAAFLSHTDFFVEHLRAFLHE